MPLSRANERMVLDALRQALGSMLHAYPTSVDEDAQLLRDLRKNKKGGGGGGGGGGDGSRVLHKRMALAVRRGEKAILSRALARVAALQADLDDDERWTPEYERTHTALGSFKTFSGEQERRGGGGGGGGGGGDAKEKDLKRYDDLWGGVLPGAAEGGPSADEEDADGDSGGEEDGGHDDEDEGAAGASEEYGGVE